MTSVPAATLVETDLTCVVCHYNLRMQPVEGRCPECGASIRHTLTFPHLARSAPRWLVSLLDSVTVLLVALAFSVACLFVVRGGDTWLPVVLGTAAWGTAWFAVWLLTRPEPGMRDFDSVAWAWTLRVVTTVAYAGVFAPVPLYNLLGSFGIIAVVAALALLAPASCLYYNHLRRAANRLPSPRLAVQAGAMQLLMPAAALLAVGRLVADQRPNMATEILVRAPLVGIGSVGDAWAFLRILYGRYELWNWLPLSTAPAAVLVLCSAAVLIQFRVAFAAAVGQAGGR